MSNIEGQIKASKAKLREIIEKTAIGYHERVYLNIEDGRVNFLAGAPGATVVAYTDFVEGEIELIEGDDLEAIVPVPELLDWIGFLDEGSSGAMEVKFVRSGDARLAEQVKLSSAGSHSSEVGLTLPASESAMENVPTQLPGMFTSDNVLQSEDGEVSTHIETYVEMMDKIIEAVDKREEMEFYPIVVDDEQFLIDVGSETGNYVNSRLQADVEGDDVDNLYGSGFSEIARTLEGQVTLHCEQDSPLMVLKELSYGTLRHVIGAAQ